jgi:hypothetical protein
VRVAELPVQGPGDLLVEVLQGGLGRLSDVAHDRVHGLALVVALLALNDVLRGDTTLRQINITYKTTSQPPDQFLVLERGPLALLLVDTEHNDDLVASNTDELLDGTDTSARKFGEQNHAVNVVVFKQLHVGAHLGDLPESTVRHAQTPGDWIQKSVPA